MNDLKGDLSVLKERTRPLFFSWWLRRGLGASPVALQVLFFAHIRNHHSEIFNHTAMGDPLKTIHAWVREWMRAPGAN